MSLRALVALALVTSPLSTTAFASEPTPPADTALLSAKTVGVLPVLAAGQNREMVFGQVAAMVERGAGHGVASPESIVSLQTDGGFAFAGASTSADLALMQYGFLLGSLATVSEDPAKLAEVVAQLTAARESLAPLAPNVVAAVDRFLASAKRGELDGTALGAAFQGASDGIARGPARAHGYFAAGLWFGISMLAAEVDPGMVDKSYLAMAWPLAVMFDEDAQFGGSDRVIAAQLRGIAGMLAGPAAVDLTAFKAALMSAFTVRADVE